MDGGLKQAKMSANVKKEIQDSARRRRGSSTSQAWSDFATVFSGEIKADADPISDPHQGAKTSRIKELNNLSQPLMVKIGHNSNILDLYEDRSWKKSQTILWIFYLEKVLPFLFPFYNPSLLQGGKAWIMEMILRRPVIRQAILCQSAYFAVVSESVTNASWEEVFTWTASAFSTLQESLKILGNLNIANNLGCAVRVMTSIVQVHRFEITILSFTNWQAHLNAIVDLIKRILGNGLEPIAAVDKLSPRIRFPVEGVQLSDAERDAFRFSCTLAVFDDIIASTVLQKHPSLYGYHRGLLCTDIQDTEPFLDFAAIFGVANLVLLQIGEIADLDAWRLDCVGAGTLDVMKLTQRAATIHKSLMTHLAELNDTSTFEILNPLDSFSRHSRTSDRVLITQIWNHAALLYLFVVTSGWQPANENVRYHVSEIVSLLTDQTSPFVLLRSAAWPFCIAGCLAEPTQEHRFRQLIQDLRPTKLFGQMHKVCEVMENAWSERNAGDAAKRDIAKCLTDLGDPVLPI